MSCVNDWALLLVEVIHVVWVTEKPTYSVIDACDIDGYSGGSAVTCEEDRVGRLIWYEYSLSQTPERGLLHTRFGSLSSPRPSLSSRLSSSTRSDCGTTTPSVIHFAPQWNIRIEPQNLGHRGSISDPFGSTVSHITDCANNKSRGAFVKQ